MKEIKLRWDDKLEKIVRAYCLKNKVTKTAIIRMLIKDFVEKYEAEKLKPSATSV